MSMETCLILALLLEALSMLITAFTSRGEIEYKIEPLVGLWIFLAVLIHVVFNL